MTAVFGEVPPPLRQWLEPQVWHRDTDSPIISLGKQGEFDDTHLLSPAVAFENGSYQMWYCGSRGTVAKRFYRLGLATSTDGVHFQKHAASPVFACGDGSGDGQHSILTPTLLRAPNGSVQRENGKLRMWFSSTAFVDKSGRHTLHETVSTDGIHWSRQSPVELENVYAPTIIKLGQEYLMWYTDVAADPWVIRHASSTDGRSWQVGREPVLTIDQPWEQQRLFYPTVVKSHRAYLMWYGSYWSGRPHTTALGFAVSLDGKKWYKHPQNPVLRPDPNRPWESHYTTSQSIMQLDDGRYRIWYASRTKPPFLNKYFALNTAIFQGPR